MDRTKYIGMDVHQASISIAVRDASGKLVIESLIETKAATILEFLQGLKGTLWVTFEEGTSAAWLYDLLKPHVVKVIVCDPRKNALLKTGNKNDRVDARKLSHLLHAGLLTPVYHGESGVRTLRELARSYLTLTKDLTRVMNRLKALYRSWAIPCVGEKVYSPRTPCRPFSAADLLAHHPSKYLLAADYSRHRRRAAGSSANSPCRNSAAIRSMACPIVSSAQFAAAPNRGGLRRSASRLRR
jgi:hypothetical protein